MITTNNEPTIQQEQRLNSTLLSPELMVEPKEILFNNNQSLENTKNQQLLHSQFITHNPKAGLNPLVDAAAYLFSIIGQLKQQKTQHHLHQLHKELVTEINIFQEAVKSQGYSAEYILVSRYALCATIDDIITSTPWGREGQWQPYSMLTIFNQDTGHEERFFLILDRIIKDTAIYIDVLELMYICLSLGYKGNCGANEFNHTQLEKVTQILYKHIRAHHGDFSKVLSPFPIKPSAVKPIPSRLSSYGLIFLITFSFIMLLFIGLSCMVDAISNNAYQELMHIGNRTSYEIHNS